MGGEVPHFALAPQVGYAITSTAEGCEENQEIGQKKTKPVIGFDMGGTSTDVSRFDGSFEHIFESTTAGVSIRAPQVKRRETEKMILLTQKPAACVMVVYILVCVCVCVCLQLDINTVAAGGGSRLFFRSGMFVVGPESAGADPGPVCYGKGLENLSEREREHDRE